MLAAPLQMFALVSLLALIVALALLVTMSWRGLQRLEPFAQHLEQQRNLLALNRSVQDLIADHSRSNNEPNTTKLAALRVRISALLAAGGFADPTTPASLRTAVRLLDNRRDVSAALHEASARLQDSLASEARARQRSIAAFYATARVELILAVIAVLVLPATALLVLVILRERITRPLRDLNDLLALLGDQSLRSAPVAGVVVPLQPIMENYNQLVTTLADALGKNKSYQAQLESQVRAAAETLLRQRIELSEADRLSAIGEMSARVAHELRNPLAGIQMGLANLVQECVDADQRERLQLIAAEVTRMARLLDQLLVPERRHREQRQKVEVRGLVLELLELARYQIPAPIKLVNDVPESLTCCLQRDAMRQMLLNLVLNASQALGERSGAITVTATREAAPSAHFRA